MVASTATFLAAGKFGLAPTVKNGTNAACKLQPRANAAGLITNDPTGTAMAPGAAASTQHVHVLYAAQLKGAGWHLARPCPTQQGLSRVVTSAASCWVFFVLLGWLSRCRHWWPVAYVPHTASAAMTPALAPPLPSACRLHRCGHPGIRCPGPHRWRGHCPGPARNWWPVSSSPCTSVSSSRSPSNPAAV